MKNLSLNSKYILNPIHELDKVVENLKKKNKKIVKLNIGDPTLYFPTPKYIIDAYIQALKLGKTCYSRSEGINQLINAVITRYKRLYNITLNDNSVITTAGISESLLFLNSALINPGDFAILFAPSYSQFIPNLKMFGGKPIFSKYNEGNNWNINIDHLSKILKQLKLSNKIKNIKYMLIANPNNPTGTVLSLNSLKQFVDLANEYDILLISDEIYDEIVYNNAKFISIGTIAKDIPHVILSGLSKTFSATGFRIGFTLIPEQDNFSEKLKKKVNRLYITAPFFKYTCAICGYRSYYKSKTAQHIYKRNG